MNLRDIQLEVHEIAKEKGFWDEVDFNISEKLMLIVSELGEACEALRKNNRQNDMVWKKDTLEDELADAAIRLLDLSQKLGINLEWQIRNKTDYNKRRSYKHGKHF